MASPLLARHPSQPIAPPENFQGGRLMDTGTEDAEDADAAANMTGCLVLNLTQLSWLRCTKAV